MRVLKGNPNIVINKFVKGLAFTVGLTIISYTVNFLSSNPNIFPEEYAFISGLVITFLQCLKKAMEKYDPDRDKMSGVYIKIRR